MDTWSVASAAVLAVLFCLAIAGAALLWKRGRPAGAKRPNHRVFLVMGAVMVPIGLVETVLFWVWDEPLVIPLPLLVIGLLLLVVGLANRGAGRGPG